MKSFKQLLCFIIPSVVCWILYFLPSVLSYDIINKPSFMGIENYLRIFLNDSLFIKTLFNTISPYILITVIMVILALALKYLLKKKYKYFNFIFYSSVLILNTACYHFYQLFLVWSYNSLNYNPISSFRYFYTFDFNSLLLSLQWGIFACFLFWLGNLIIEKIKNRKVK